MLCVKTKIKESKIEGIGLFADEFIPKGTIIWKFTPGFDLKFTKEQVESFPKSLQDYLWNYMWMSKKSGMFCFSSDNGKYFNHSKTPNALSQYYDDEDEVITKAIKDIMPGEEITDDYSSFEDGYNYDEIYKKTKIIFVRHAESTKNVDKIIDGTDEMKYKLTQKGQKQTQELKDFLLNENVDLIFCSNFQRAIETIKPFSIESGIEVITDERLKETHHGVYEGLGGENKRYIISKNKFMESKKSRLGETGDNQEDVLKRFKEFISEKIEKHKGKTIVIISHGFPLSIILNELDKKNDYFSDEFKPKNAKPIILEI